MILLYASQTTARELAEKVLASPIDHSIKVFIGNSPSVAKEAHALSNKVGNWVRKAGWRIQSRTDGLGHLYLAKGSKIDHAS